MNVQTQLTAHSNISFVVLLSQRLCNIYSQFSSRDYDCNNRYEVDNLPQYFGNQLQVILTKFKLFSNCQKMAIRKRKTQGKIFQILIDLPRTNIISP